jgi:hypothetical protein
LARSIGTVGLCPKPDSAALRSEVMHFCQNEPNKYCVFRMRFDSSPEDYHCNKPWRNMGANITHGICPECCEKWRAEGKLAPVHS